MLFSVIICHICSFAMTIKRLLSGMNCHIWILTRRESFFPKMQFFLHYQKKTNRLFSSRQMISTWWININQTAGTNRPTAWFISHNTPNLKHLENQYINYILFHAFQSTDMTSHKIGVANMQYQLYLTTIALFLFFLHSLRIPDSLHQSSLRGQIKYP